MDDLRAACRFGRGSNRLRAALARCLHGALLDIEGADVRPCRHQALKQGTAHVADADQANPIIHRYPPALFVVLPPLPASASGRPSLRLITAPRVAACA